MFQTWLGKKALSKIQVHMFTAFAFFRKAAANRSISALSESLSNSLILSNASLGLVGVQGSVLELDPPDWLFASCSTREAFITMICIKSVISVAWAFALKRFAVRIAFFLSFAKACMFFFNSFFGAIKLSECICAANNAPAFFVRFVFSVAASAFGAMAELG